MYRQIFYDPYPDLYSQYIYLIVGGNYNLNKELPPN